MESRVGISVTLEVVCGKWKGLILWKLLQDESLRFNALRRSLDGNISSRILARELKQLMNDGLVERIDPIRPSRLMLNTAYPPTAGLRLPFSTP